MEAEQQRNKWVNEKKLVNLRYATEGELFQLNVSGLTAGFLLNKELLCSVPNTALEAKFSGRYQIEKING
jgi:hypothetical protein